MNTAEELLNSLAEEAEAGTATEGHIVIGRDREVTVPDELRRIAVQYDHNVETVTFDCPRYWDKCDLALMRIYINYMRPDGQVGSYLVEDVTVDAEDKNMIHFTWTVSGNVTQYAGDISFLVCAKKVDAKTGLEEVHWNSALNSEMHVAEGMKCLDTVLRRYPDIISQLLIRMETCEKTVRPEEYLAVLDAIEGFQNDVDAVKDSAITAAADAKESAQAAVEAANSAMDAAMDASAAVKTAEQVGTNTAKLISDEETARKAEIDIERKRIDAIGEGKISDYDTLMANTVEGYHTDALAVKEGFARSGGLYYKFDTETGAPMWSIDGVDWHFFEHWHIGAAGVPDKTLTDDYQGVTEPAGCFTKLTNIYHKHSKENGCYNTVYKDCMVLSPHWDPGEAAQGAVVWKCTVCGKYSGDTGTSQHPTDPCYHYVDVLNCTKTVGVFVDKTYYACDCGKTAGGYTKMRYQ